VLLLAGKWIPGFLDECEAWPRGRRNDRLDAAVGAFNKLAVSSGFELAGMNRGMPKLIQGLVLRGMFGG
jgi:hypothetical protein